MGDKLTRPRLATPTQSLYTNGRRASFKGPCCVAYPSSVSMSTKLPSDLLIFWPSRTQNACAYTFLWCGVKEEWS